MENNKDNENKIDEKKYLQLGNFVINNELDKFALDDKISSIDVEFSLFNEIELLSDIISGKSNLSLSGFTDKIDGITDYLSKIYEPKTGLLRLIQNILLKINNDKLLSSVNILWGINNISVEDELFLKGIFLKWYATNYQQLILPFFDVGSDILIMLKEQRINQLQKTSAIKGDFETTMFDIKKQIIELNKQIDTLKYDVSMIEQNHCTLDEKKEKLNNFAEDKLRNILNDYFDFHSFRKKNNPSETSEITSIFGSKELKIVISSKFITKCIEFYMQISEKFKADDFQAISNLDEKQIKIIQLVYDLRLNLIILGQEAFGAFADNLLDTFVELQDKKKKEIKENILSKKDEISDNSEEVKIIEETKNNQTSNSKGAVLIKTIIVIIVLAFSIRIIWKIIQKNKERKK